MKTMKHLFLFLLSLLVALGCSGAPDASTSATDAGPQNHPANRSSGVRRWRVYITEGQSNDAGHGPVSELPATQKAPDRRWISWDAEGPPWGDDKLGWFPTTWSDGGPQPRSSTHPPPYYGPELSFGLTMADLGYHVAIIKYAHGGTPLGKDWLPSEHLDYDVLLKVVRSALAALDAADDPYELAGVIPVMGDGDASNAALAADWTKNFETFIAALRLDLGAPHLPIIFTRLCPCMTTRIYLQTVYDQETTYPLTHPFTSVIDTDDGELLTTSTVHFDGPSLWRIGERIAHTASLTLHSR